MTSKRIRAAPIEGENPAASAVEAAAATINAYGDDGEGARRPATAACGGTAKKRLSDAEIQSILSRERREFAPDTSNMSEEEAKIIRRGVETFNVLNDDFAEYQAGVRAQYEAKGYVEEEGDDFVEYSEEELQWLREQLAHMFDGLDFSDVQQQQQQQQQQQEEEEEEDYSNESEEEGEADMSPESKFE